MFLLKNRSAGLSSLGTVQDSTARDPNSMSAAERLATHVRPPTHRRHYDSPIHQPCRCLWRGFLHTTKTTPRRRTILQLSQMRLTLARTFMVLTYSGEPTCNPANIMPVVGSVQGAACEEEPHSRMARRGCVRYLSPPGLRR